MSRLRISRTYARDVNYILQLQNETRRVYDGMDVVQERNQYDVTTASYTRTGNIGGILARTSSSGSVFYGYDGGGNVTTLTNSSGAEVGSYTYDAFGNTVAQSGGAANENPYRFSTKEQIGGLYSYGLRFYSPGLGRWINRDPIGEAGGVNLYMAFANDPANEADAYGLDLLDDASNFSAGMGDHLSFGGTRLIRQGFGYDDVVDHTGTVYGVGTAAGVVVDVAATGGSMALTRGAARATAIQLATDRRVGRQVLGLARGNPLKAHHVNPLKGHPGRASGRSTIFPTAGLPSALRNHPANLKALDHTSHMAAHRRMRRAETVARRMGLANSKATAVRGGATAGRTLYDNAGNKCP